MNNRMTRDKALQWLFDFGTGWVTLKDLRHTWANEIKIIEWNLCIYDGTMEKQLGEDGFEFRITPKALELLKE